MSHSGSGESSRNPNDSETLPHGLRGLGGWEMTKEIAVRFVTRKLHSSPFELIAAGASMPVIRSEM